MKAEEMLSDPEVTEMVIQLQWSLGMKAEEMARVRTASARSSPGFNGASA